MANFKKKLTCLFNPGDAKRHATVNCAIGDRIELIEYKYKAMSKGLLSVFVLPFIIFLRMAGVG